MKAPPIKGEYGSSWFEGEYGKFEGTGNLRFISYMSDDEAIVTIRYSGEYFSKEHIRAEFEIIIQGHPDPWELVPWIREVYRTLKKISDKLDYCYMRIPFQVVQMEDELGLDPSNNSVDAALIIDNSHGRLRIKALSVEGEEYDFFKGLIKDITESESPTFLGNHNIEDGCYNCKTGKRYLIKIKKTEKLLDKFEDYIESTKEARPKGKPELFKCIRCGNYILKGLPYH
jgi:hypothetical protein